MRYQGIGAVPGIAIGPAYCITNSEWNFPEQIIDAAQLGQEFQRLYDGISNSKVELNTLKQSISTQLGDDELRIFDVHLAILEDPIFMTEIQNTIRKQYKVAEVAVKEVIDRFSHLFEGLDDDYMKERSLDIRDVGNRLLMHLIGELNTIDMPEEGPFIAVADELTPSQLVHLDPERLQGIVFLSGGTTSHTVIMARAMGIPCIAGIDSDAELPIESGDLLIIDGESGILDIRPDEQTIELTRQRMASRVETEQSLRNLIPLTTETRDGIRIHLSANVGFPLEIDRALHNGAEGIGLYRTEFLYLDRHDLPTEEQLFQVYKSAVEKMNGKPFVMRTLDIGADKKPDYLYMAAEDNPYLGMRGIRVTLRYPDMFRIQLRAILRASCYGPIKIMYPFITSVEEVREANRILAEVKGELQDMECDNPPHVEVGVMIEVPSAIIIADLLAQEVDFFSIGTNDLVQYILAVDRTNSQVDAMFDPFHPAVLRSLQTIIKAAQEHHTSLSVCGELAGDIRFLPIWLGLGVTQLSMASQAMLPIKQRIRNLSAQDCLELIKRLFACGTKSELSKLVEEFNIQHA